jgi:sec-independent protein translocase protein TatC
MAQLTSPALPDPDDMFADTRMSIGDHIEDLRSHLLRAVAGFIVGIVVCISPWVGPYLLKFITDPVEVQLRAFYNRYSASRYLLMEKEIRDSVRPVPVIMNVHVPTLKLILAGERPKLMDRPSWIVAGSKRALADALDGKVGPSKADDLEWAELPIEIPDPTVLSKAMADINRQILPKGLSTLNVQEAFIVYVKVSLMFGFVLSSPWVFYQLWSFVAAGLYPHEKRLVNHYLPISLGLFLAGFAVCEFLALPKAIEALLWFNEWLGFEPDLRLNEWLSFAIIMPLVFGLSFQTPIVMMFMYKIGIADLDTFRSKRRISYFIMAIFSAIITPSTDVPTMLMLWLPMCLLYEVGIWLCKMQPQTLADEMDDSELDEMVGV